MNEIFSTVYDNNEYMIVSFGTASAIIDIWKEFNRNQARIEHNSTIVDF